MARLCTPDGKRNLISARLVELRREHNLSQRELANCLQLYGIDMDKNAITRIETNKRYVTDIELRAIAHDVAAERGIRVQEGVYLGALGPSFETPAEIRMFRSWGADTVAMSVCEEVIAARHVGMRVLGISLVSNMGCGIEGASPTGLEVLDVAKTREVDFSRLITGIVEQL